MTKSLGLLLLFLIVHSGRVIGQGSLLEGDNLSVVISHHWKQRKMNEGRHYLKRTNVGQNEENNCKMANVWFVWDNCTRSCRCGKDLDGVVQCNTDTRELSVLECNCLTVEYTVQGELSAVVGNCIFNCANFTRLNKYNVIYHSAPTDCASLNRQGTLCGQCLDGYTVPAYSYELKCIRCDSQLENWGLYIVFAFLPLTVFIVIILVFRINVVSPILHNFVYAVQFVTLPVFMKIILYIISQTSRGLNVPIKVLLGLYGIWNLDFLRVNVLPDVCINDIPLHILVLDYLIAIYPMLLMAVAYTIVELYGFGFRPLQYIWKPFHYFFARCRRHWGIQNTIMDAFVTFFFLSTTKLLSVSFALLMGAKTFTSDGKLHSWNLYYNPSVQFFGREHLPYALLAIAILTVFIVFPTSLLLFYQCKAYKRCLTKCQISGQALDEFVSTFQKYYKDGSSGTFDCRWFAGFFILLKLFGYMVYAVSPSQFFLYFFVYLSIIGTAVIVIVQPYKEEYAVFNIVTANLFLWCALYSTSVTVEAVSITVQPFFSDHYISSALMALVPLVYIIVVVLYHLIRRFRGQKGGDGLTSSLPHRLLHSDQYRDTLHTIAAVF